MMNTKNNIQVDFLKFLYAKKVVEKILNI